MSDRHTVYHKSPLLSLYQKRPRVVLARQLEQGFVVEESGRWLDGLGDGGEPELVSGQGRELFKITTN